MVDSPSKNSPAHTDPASATPTASVTPAPTRIATPSSNTISSRAPQRRLKPRSVIYKSTNLNTTAPELVALASEDKVSAVQAIQKANAIAEKVRDDYRLQTTPQAVTTAILGTDDKSNAKKYERRLKMNRQSAAASRVRREAYTKALEAELVNMEASYKKLLALIAYEREETQAAELRCQQLRMEQAPEENGAVEVMSGVANDVSESSPNGPNDVLNDGQGGMNEMERDGTELLAAVSSSVTDGVAAGSEGVDPDMEKMRSGVTHNDEELEGDSEVEVAGSAATGSALIESMPLGSPPLGSPPLFGFGDKCENILPFEDQVFGDYLEIPTETMQSLTANPHPPLPHAFLSPGSNGSSTVDGGISSFLNMTFGR